MEKRTIATDIAEIAKRLDGKVNLESIKYSQIIFDDYKATGVNDLVCIKKAHGVYFYTSKSQLERACYLDKVKMPIYVALDESSNVFEIE